MSVALDWKIALREIGERGLSGEREASAAERAELAKTLDLKACDTLRAVYKVQARGPGIYVLRGKISADVVQSCVVTLEPIPAHIEEDMDVELRPRELMPEPEDSDQDILNLPDVEAIESDGIDLGNIVTEHVATALDPYPRKEGAELDFEDPAAADPTAKPFAKLAKLKNPS